MCERDGGVREPPFPTLIFLDTRVYGVLDHQKMASLQIINLIISGTLKNYVGKELGVDTTLNFRASV